MAVLELANISKHFGAIQAVNDVSLSLEAGQVVGLMGDNGAGKSTLVKIIAGNFPPSEGEIRINNKAVHFHKPVDAGMRALRHGRMKTGGCSRARQHFQALRRHPGRE